MPVSTEPVPIGSLVDAVLARYPQRQGGPMKRKPKVRPPALPMEMAPQPAVPPPASAETNAAKALRIVQLKKEAGAMYAEIERLLEELLVAHRPPAGERLGPPIALGGQAVFRLVDPFIDARSGQPQKLWKHQPISRFDFEVVTQ